MAVDLSLKHSVSAATELKNMKKKTYKSECRTAWNQIKESGAALTCQKEITCLG